MADIQRLQQDILGMLNEIDQKHKRERMLKRRELEIEASQIRIRSKMPEEPRTYVMN
jgi:hypothetical protein